MTFILLLVAVVILLCVIAEKFSGRFGMPALILFMFIGMLFGSDGIFKIPFNDYKLAENICSIALLFIMFYGGFNLKWELAKGVAVKSVLLSTIGVAVTAAVHCHCIVRQTGLELFLAGKLSGRCSAWFHGRCERVCHSAPEKTKSQGQHCLPVRDGERQ